MSRERAPWRAGVAVAGAVLVIGTLTLHRHLVGVFYDDGLFAGLATALALARGDGDVHPHLPGRAYLERQGVTHVLLASASGESAAPLRVLIAAYPDWLVPVRRWDGARWLFAVAAAAP